MAKGENTAPALDFPGRIALSITEAAKALGISERHLRTMLRGLPHVRLGRRVLLPVDQLREEMKARALAEKSRTDDIADTILDEVNKPRDKK